MPRARPGPSGRDPDPPHDRTLLFAMVRLVNLTARPFQEGIGRRHRLGLSEWRVLAVLHAHPGSAAIEIAQRTGLDKMSVSRALATLTPAGRALYRALRGPARERERAVTGALSAAERRQLMSLVERMTASALAADGAAGVAR